MTLPRRFGINSSITCDIYPTQLSTLILSVHPVKHIIASRSMLMMSSRRIRIKISGHSSPEGV